MYFCRKRGTEKSNLNYRWNVLSPVFERCQYHLIYVSYMIGLYYDTFQMSPLCYWYPEVRCYFRVLLKITCIYWVIFLGCSLVIRPHLLQDAKVPIHLGNRAPAVAWFWFFPFPCYHYNTHILFCLELQITADDSWLPFIKVNAVFFAKAIVGGVDLPGFSKWG